MKFREVIIPDYAGEEWKDIKLNIGGSHSTLQDIKVQKQASGFCYKNDEFIRNRFIYWRTCDDIVLELSENSLDVNLKHKNLRITFEESPILSVFISENQDHVIILVATISNIHRFQFIHPRRNIGANGEQNENSIFSSITQESVKDPTSYYTISNLLAQNVPHSASCYLSLTSEEAYFAVAHTNHLLLFQMNCFTGHTGVTELKNFQIFPKIFSNLTDAIRGKNNVNDSNYVTSMVFDTIGGENVLYALYRDNNIRMWSTRTGQCLYTLNIFKNHDERRSQGTQSNILKKSTTSTSICVFLSYGNGSEFQLFKPVWDGANSFSIVPTNLITAPQFDLVDFELTDQKLWGLWCNSEGDMHISAYILEPASMECWRTAVLEGISGKRRTVEAEMDAKHIYCSNIFRPGKFQASTISKALMMFSRSTNYSDAFTPMHILKERVCQAIDAEIQNEMKMHDLSEDEYIEVAVNNWEKFYSCCEQYHIAAHQAVGIFVLDSLDAVCVIKTSLMSFLRPCDIIENMLLSGLCPDEFDSDDKLEQDLASLVKTLYYLENNLSMDVKIEISNNLFKLKMANVIISDLISQMRCEDDLDVAIPRELIDDVGERLRAIRDVQSAISVLLNLLRLDKNNFSDDEFNDELTTFQKQLFGGNYGSSLVSETVRQISSSRFAMCRNLLIVQNILIDGFSLNCNEAEIIRSKHIPETVIFLQSYYVMVWIGEDAFAAPQSKANAIGFNTQGGYSQSSSLLQLFVKNKGLQFALKLYYNAEQMDDDNDDYEMDNFWSKNLLKIASFIERFVWAISGRFIFGEWLSTTQQHLLIEEYVRLLNEWCEYNSCSRQFVLGLSFLETGEANKAFDMFIKSAKGVLSEPFLTAYVGAQDLKTSNEILAQYYLKVMRLFEKYEIYDCVINIAEIAIGTADKESQLAMFQSIIFNNHMHLKHYEEAYHSLIHNVELSRRKDCLRQLVIMLFQEKRFDILINFPYNGLEQDLQNIVETRARSMQIENNEHYNFLYSYHIKTSNMKRASVVMYEKALRYLYEGGTVEALQHRYNSLLACYNALLLVDIEYRWLAKPVIEDPKNDDDADDVMESESATQIEVIDIEEIKKEMLVAEALLCVAKAKDLKLIMQMGPKELVVLLSTQRFFTNALKLAKGYKLTLTPIFESLTLACIKSSNIEFNDNLDWLNQNNLSDLTLTVSFSEMPWIYLRKLLEEEDIEMVYYRDVVKHILANQAFIPQWLLDTYKKQKASELLYLYLQYGRLDEAAELAIDFVRAYLGYGNELFGFKHYVAKTHPSFPINTMDLLLYQLKAHGEKDQICKENYNLLKTSIDEYLKTANTMTLENNDNVDDFWKDFDGSESEDNDADGGDENEDSNGASDEEEEEETELKEVTIKFSDIEKRLLNPKVVRACTWALQSWEKMSYREIKSAVTILHRIAVNLKMPIMLMNAQLFRIFQQVFNVPKDIRYEELRRIGIYIIRQFVKLVPRNPKIFAELLFFSSHRECHEIEHGYDEPFGEHEGKAKAWSEEQEEELRHLFMRNQESPETDQDVIDWIVENLKERNRTRRGVIKKLKELGLIFKAPTKKSNAAAANKNLFMKDEDEKLRELYDEHRLDKHCLAKIMEVFKGKRSKKAIVKRMIQLHLIADETEILPPKRSSKKNQENGDSERHSESDERSESDESDNDEDNSRIERHSRQSMSVSRSNYQISQRDVTNYRIELEESLKEAIEWIIELLKEAAEDFEEVSDEISDSIPIVPFSESQKLALENPQFQGLLRSINLIEPHDTETYWKIPANMLPDDLQKRAQLLSGEIPIISQHDTAKNSDSENDNDDDSDLFSRLRAQHNALVYNQSDNEDDRPKPSVNSKKNTKKPQQKVSKLNTKLIKKLHPQLSVEHGSTMQWLVELLDEKISNKASKSTLIDEMLIVPSTNDQKESLEGENFQKLLAALSLIPPNGIESYWQIPESLTVKELKKRVELLKVKNTQNESTDESDSEQMIIKRKKPKATRESQDNNDDDFGISTQQLKERLAELESSSDDNDDMTDMNQSTKQQNKKIINRHILDSSDDDHSGADDAKMTKQIIKPNEIKEKRKSEKRERSQSPDENEMNASNNNSNSNPMKKIRRIIDSDNDDE